MNFYLYVSCVCYCLVLCLFYNTQILKGYTKDEILALKTPVKNYYYYVVVFFLGEGYVGEFVTLFLKILVNTLW